MPIVTHLVYANAHQTPKTFAKSLKITVRLTPSRVHPASMIFLTTGEVSKRLQVDEATVRKWLRQGKIMGIKLPGKAGWRVREGALMAWLEAQEVHRG